MSFPTPTLPPPLSPPSVSTGTPETEPPAPALGFGFFGPNPQPLCVISIGPPNYPPPYFPHPTNPLHHSRRPFSLAPETESKPLGFVPPFISFLVLLHCIATC